MGRRKGGGTVTDIPTNTYDSDWPELVSTALVGTDRRSAAPSAGHLLARAAMVGAWRRAGSAGAVRVCDPIAGPGLSDPDPRPLLSAAASSRLAVLLAAGADFLPEYLAAAATTGCRAPAELLPPLFDYARRHLSERADVMTLAGPRGRWLAGHNPNWSTLVATVPARSTALPEDSALSERMAARLVEWVRVVRQKGRVVLDLTGIPTPLPPDAIGDGLGDGAIGNARLASRSQSSMPVENLFAFAPLSAWDAFEFSPAQLLMAEAATAWEREAAHRGWRAATVRQRNSEWAEALCELNATTELLDLLTPDATEAWARVCVAVHRRRHALHDVPGELSRLYRPWPEAACVDLLNAMPEYLPKTPHGRTTRYFGNSKLAGRWMPPTFAAAVAAKADAIRGDYAEWAADLDDLASMLHDRTTMLEELDRSRR